MFYSIEYYTPITFRRSDQQIHGQNPVIICLATVHASDNKRQCLKFSSYNNILNLPTALMNNSGSCGQHYLKHGVVI
jgi:hypothetical protein